MVNLPDFFTMTIYASLDLYFFILSVKITFRKSLDARWQHFLWIFPTLLLLVGCVAFTEPKNSEGDNPFPSLPFPDVELVQSWEVAENLILLEGSCLGIRAFYLQDRISGDTGQIIGGSDHAVYREVRDGKLYFVAQGGFLSLVYDLALGKLSREQLYLPLMQGSAFGNEGTQHVLTDLILDGPRLHFIFIPREGEVLSGCHNFPLTTIRYREDSHMLVLRFYGVECADSIERYPFYQKGEMAYPIYFYARSGGEFLEEDLALLQQDAPFGLRRPSGKGWGRIQKDRIGVEVRIELVNTEGYSIAASAGETQGKTEVRYSLEFLSNSLNPLPQFATDADISVRGVMSGADSSLVRAFFGEPLSEEREVQESHQNPDYLTYWDRWVYDDIEFLFLSSGKKGEPGPERSPKVYFIYLTGNGFETDAGFRVGDPLRKVFGRYGVQEVFMGELGSTVVYEGFGLQTVVFFFEDGAVTRMELGIPLS